jgi:hypothetical protein
MKSYLDIYEQADDGAWGAHSPDVEGVFALGASRVEVEERISEALRRTWLTCASPGGRCPTLTLTHGASPRSARRRGRFSVADT